MLDTLTVEFPHIEDEEAESTYKEHDHKESVSHSCHNIECEWEKNGHVIHLKLVNFFKPSFNDGIILWGLIGPNDTVIKSLIGLIGHLLFPLRFFTFLSFTVTLLRFGPLVVNIDHVFDKLDNDKNSEYQCG